MGAFHSTKNSGNFGTGANGTEISLESVEFPKCEPFNRKFRKFQEQNRKGLKFPGTFFRKFRSTLRGCPLFRKFWKTRYFTLSPSSFGREFSDLGSWKQLHVLRKRSWNLNKKLRPRGLLACLSLLFCRRQQRNAPKYITRVQANAIVLLVCLLKGPFYCGHDVSHGGVSVFGMLFYLQRYWVICVANLPQCNFHIKRISIWKFCPAEDT